jgi:hypothetical protein
MLIIQIVIIRYRDHGQHLFLEKFHHLAINKGGVINTKDFWGKK